MKKINFWNLAILLLGIGIGIIISVAIFYYNPIVKNEEYSDSQIIERYTEIMLKEQRQEEKNKENIKKEDVKDNENSENKEMEEKKEREIEFTIEKGESLDTIIDNLYESKIIDNKNSFLDRLKLRQATGKIQYGKYQIKLPIAYDNLIDEIIIK
ncbi:MAG: hypothetical protein ACTHVE_06195 [Senegalia sp. (in: firmicutes)]|uniref:hypothetical protein n=1 Tax=Senegalia sp. (in: firmicutes) TaxID=1924098 RepID=UPI003F977185